MKLNYKRTFLVGFAFFLITMFWQTYDTIIPKILTDHFGMKQSFSGIIMALDNIFALFMLPLFGAISDKCKAKMGKRKPFILIGTIVSVCAFLLLTLADAKQLDLVGKVSKIDDEESLSYIYDNIGNEKIKTPDGDEFVLSERYTKDEFVKIKSSVYEAKISADRIYAITKDGEFTIESKYKTRIISYDKETFFLRDRKTENDSQIVYFEIDGEEVEFSELFVKENFSNMTNSVYTNYVSPARQAYVNRITNDDPSHLILFVSILVIILISMATFRSPAVALMPDVTPKPLRSKGNAVINLIGNLGGAIVLLLGMGFAFNTSAIENTFTSYFPFFLTVSILMTAALVIFMICVKERKWASEAEAIEEREDAENSSGMRSLSKSEKVSFILILLSILFWFFGYNAFSSKYSVYATSVLDLDYSSTLLLANIAAIVSFIPIGIISSKIGRKKCILAGIVMLAGSFFAVSFFRVGVNPLIMTVILVIAGIGWATINVNSFPMVVELSKGGDIGRYTGYYYSASMAAQVLTPFFSGLLMDKIGMTSLFPYCAVFVALSFVTMLFVRHGDSKPEAKKEKLEVFADMEN